MRKSFFEVALISGLLTAFACFLFLLLLYVLGLNPFGQYKFLYLPIYAGGVVGGLKFFMDYRNGGYLNGGRSVLMTMIINLSGAAVYAILIYVLLAFIDTAVLDLHKKELTELLLRYKSDAGELLDIKLFEAQFASIKTITAGDVAIDEWIKTSAIGLVLSMATAVIMKKTPPPTQ
ncbi:MAG: DUF4199 domain-containing protein [Cytophagales bacterium]|nr:MAG: DUF4199 domain-containing protein [Cytophagales bacterium]